MTSSQLLMTSSAQDTGIRLHVIRIRTWTHAVGEIAKDFNEAAWNAPQERVNIWAKSGPQSPHADAHTCDGVHTHTHTHTHTNPGSVWPFSRVKKTNHRNQTIQWRETHTHSGSVWRPLRYLPKATGMSTTAFSLRSFCPPILRQHSLLHFSFSPSLTSTFTSPFDYNSISGPTAEVSWSFMFSFLNCSIEWWII